MDQRREKINELKARIKGRADEVTEHVKAYMAETDEEKKKEISKQISGSKAMTDGLKKELELIRMNTTGSKFFEWHPHVGMNRRTARNFRRQKRI